MHRVVSTGFALQAAASVAGPNKPWGGEDGYVFSSRLVGVADGVGSWAKRGIDAGKLSRAVMTEAGAVAEESRGDVSAREVLEIAHDRTRGLGGTTTAAIAKVHGSRLDVATLGDSRLFVARAVTENKMRFFFASKEQRHAFNHPFQLGHTATADAPAAAATTALGVRAGDVVMACTDGVTDNLFDKEIVQLLSAHLCPAVVRRQSPEECQAALDAAVAALMEAAQARAADKDAATPWGAECIEEGMIAGGKPDDTTVVLSMVGAVAREVSTEDLVSSEQLRAAAAAYAARQSRQAGIWA